MIRKRFRLSGILICEHSRHQPGDAVDHHHGRQFPAGKHIVANGYIIRHNGLQHPLIYPLIMAAQKNKILFLRKLPCHLLVKDASLRRHIDHPVSALIRSGLPHLPLCDPSLRFQISVVDRLSLHEHPRAASVRVIVHFFMFILRIISDIQRFQTDKPRFFRSADNTFPQSLQYHIGEQCQNVKICHISVL